MALVRIFSTTGIEIEYKKDSLTLRKENNSMSSDFKVPHSSFPFLIIENDICKTVLGPSDITSIRKNKIVPVVILENGVRYYGEIQQLSIVPNFRKCNLKYGSDILPIVNKKISEFMPIVSVIPGETTPEPFSETGTEIITGFEHWETYPVSLIGQVYPESKFNFPTLYWLNKYGIGLDSSDAWFNYKNHVNNFGVNEAEDDIFLINTGTVVGSLVTVSNKNVPMPFVFLLSPLYYIFNSLNWKVSGNFTTHELIKRLLMVPKKDNITKILLSPSPETILFPETPDWDLLEGFGSFGNDIYRLLFYKTITAAGRYKLKFNFEINNLPDGETFDFQKTQLIMSPSGAGNTFVVFSKSLLPNSGNNYVIQGEVEFTAAAGTCSIQYFDTFQNLPITYSLEFVSLEDEKEFNQFHPTIQLGRYVPDWSVGTYLNNIKNQFNLDITLDDFKKEIILNLNESIDETELPSIINKSLSMKSYDVAAYSSFILKYGNDEDLSLFITREEVVEFDGNKDDFTKEIKSNFKFIPRNEYTSVLSEEINDKEGVGLVIYNEADAPFTSLETDNGFNLNISGEKGIYETFFRRWLKFLFNGSSCELSGNFTETEINKMNKSNSVYINNQKFRVVSVETSEAANNFQEVKMNLISVNY